MMRTLEHNVALIVDFQKDLNVCTGNDFQKHLKTFRHRKILLPISSYAESFADHESAITFSNCSLYHEIFVFFIISYIVAFISNDCNYLHS